MNKKEQKGVNVTNFVYCYINPRRDYTQEHKNIDLYSRPTQELGAGRLVMYITSSYTKPYFN